MEEIARERETGTHAEVRIRPLEQPGDLGWVVMAHGERYAEEFGWDTRFEALVARIVAAYTEHSTPGRDAAWVAELGARRVGCVFCVALDDETARLRLLLVDPSARGHGIGARLVDTCVSFARAAGYRRMTLWTQSVLHSARRIYRAAGFTLAAEERHDGFGAELVGETWVRDL